MKCTSCFLSHFDACTSYVRSTPKSTCKALLSLFKIQTKGSILYLALSDRMSFEQTTTSVSALSVPSDTLLWWAGSVYLYQVLCIRKKTNPYYAGYVLHCVKAICIIIVPSQEVYIIIQNA